MNASDLSPDNLARLEEKLKADLAMVQKVRALMSEHLSGAFASVSTPPATSVISPPNGAPQVPAPIAMVQRPPPRDVNDVVREIVPGLDGPFGMKHVKAKIDPKEGYYPDTSVRSVLNRMVQRGDLVIVRHQLGRAGSTYQRTGKGKAE